jgi:hypothetical protein
MPALTTDYGTGGEANTLLLVTLCQKILNAAPMLSMSRPDIDSYLRARTVLDRVDKHAKGVDDDTRFKKLNTSELRSLMESENLPAAERFLAEIFDDLVISTFEVDKEKAVREGYIHAIAEAIVGVEKNTLYYVDEASKKGFAFNAKTADGKFIEEKFFNFEDVGDASNEARRRLKEAIAVITSKQVRDGELDATDAVRVLAIADCRTNQAAIAAINDYNCALKDTLSIIERRAYMKDRSHLASYRQLESTISVYIFNRSRKMRLLNMILHQEYSDASREYEAVLSEGSGKVTYTSGFNRTRGRTSSSSSKGSKKFMGIFG